jgi:hypothetical protein
MGVFTQGGVDRVGDGDRVADNWASSSRCKTIVIGSSGIVKVGSSAGAGISGNNKRYLRLV